MGHDRAVPAVIVQLEGRGPGLHHGGDGRETGCVDRYGGLENRHVAVAACDEAGASRHLAQIAVGGLVALGFGAIVARWITARFQSRQARVDLPITTA